jgi:LacI family transcriptional regulator
MSISTKDIAKIANVSQSTVSRCLNDSPMISQKTKDKVKKIADEYGFQFNASAKSLKSNKTGSVGLIIPKKRGDFENIHFRAWQDSLMENLEQIGFDVIISFFENHNTGQNNIMKLVRSKKVDALILLQPKLDEETMGFLEKTKIPYVFCKYFPDGCKAKNIDYIHVDQFEGGYLATSHLIRLGHRRIMTITADFEGGEFELRQQGYEAALREHAIPVSHDFMLKGDGTFQSGFDLITKNSSLINEITAVFALNDAMAIGAISALKELGFHVPDDIAVVGFDDIELGTYFHPYLTTVSQPTKEVAKITCDRLEMLMNPKDSWTSQKVTVPPKLIIRESCGSR